VVLDETPWAVRVLPSGSIVVRYRSRFGYGGARRVAGARELLELAPPGVVEALAERIKNGSVWTAL